MTVTGRTLRENVKGRASKDREMITTYDKPLRERAGFVVLSGNLFDFAILKASVITEDFRRRYLGEAGHDNVFEGRAVVFDGSDDYQSAHQRPGAEHRRALRPRDSRRRPARLARLR